jgi:hypothetical protein
MDNHHDHQVMAGCKRHDSQQLVQATTNLANPVWTPLATNPLVGGMNYFSDPKWTNYPRRFYRVRSQ